MQKVFEKERNGNKIELFYDLDKNILSAAVNGNKCRKAEVRNKGLRANLQYAILFYLANSERENYWVLAEDEYNAIIDDLEGLSEYEHNLLECKCSAKEEAKKITLKSETDKYLSGELLIEVEYDDDKWHRGFYATNAVVRKLLERAGIANSNGFIKESHLVKDLKIDAEDVKEYLKREAKKRKQQQAKKEEEQKQLAKLYEAAKQEQEELLSNLEAPIKAQKTKIADEDGMTECWQYELKINGVVYHVFEYMMFDAGHVVGCETRGKDENLAKEIVRKCCNNLDMTLRM